MWFPKYRNVSDMIDINVVKETVVKKPSIDRASWVLKVRTFSFVPLID